MIKQKKGRIFILGISGFLGSSLAYYLRHQYSVSGVYFSKPIYIPDVHCLPMDLQKKDIVDRFLRMQEPDFTIMAAGLNDLRGVEKNLKLSDAINTYLPLSFAQASVQAGAKNIHLSCAQVFDGLSHNAKEDDKNFSAMNFGRAKASAEGFIRAQTMENTTIRFGKVIGSGNFAHPSLLDNIRNTLGRGERYYVYENKKYEYMSLHSFVRAIYLLLQKPFPATHRLYHLGGVARGETEMLKDLARYLKLDPELIRNNSTINQDETANVAKNRDYTLDCSKFEKEFAWKRDTEAELFENLRLQLTPKLSSNADFMIPN